MMKLERCDNDGGLCDGGLRYGIMQYLKSGNMHSITNHDMLAYAVLTTRSRSAYG